MDFESLVRDLFPKDHAASLDHEERLEFDKRYGGKADETISFLAANKALPFQNDVESFDDPGLFTSLRRGMGFYTDKENALIKKQKRLVEGQLQPIQQARQKIGATLALALAASPQMSNQVPPEVAKMMNIDQPQAFAEAGGPMAQPGQAMAIPGAPAGPMASPSGLQAAPNLQPVFGQEQPPMMRRPAPSLGNQAMLQMPLGTPGQMGALSEVQPFTDPTAAPGTFSQFSPEAMTIPPPEIAGFQTVMDPGTGGPMRHVQGAPIPGEPRLTAQVLDQPITMADRKQVPQPAPTPAPRELPIWQRLQIADTLKAQSVGHLVPDETGKLVPASLAAGENKMLTPDQIDAAAQLHGISEPIEFNRSVRMPAGIVNHAFTQRGKGVTEQNVIERSFNPETGQMEFVIVDKKSGRVRPVEGAQPAPEGNDDTKTSNEMAQALFNKPTFNSLDGSVTTEEAANARRNGFRGVKAGMTRKQAVLRQKQADFVEGSVASKVGSAKAIEEVKRDLSIGPESNKFAKLNADGSIQMATGNMSFNDLEKGGFVDVSRHKEAFEELPNVDVVENNLSKLRRYADAIVKAEPGILSTGFQGGKLTLQGITKGGEFTDIRQNGRRLTVGEVASLYSKGVENVLEYYGRNLRGLRGAATEGDVNRMRHGFASRWDTKEQKDMLFNDLEAFIDDVREGAKQKIFGGQIVKPGVSKHSQGMGAATLTPDEVSLAKQMKEAGRTRAEVEAAILERRRGR